MMATLVQARMAAVKWLVLIALLWAPRVSAQEVATSFEQLRSRLKQGDTLEVTDTNDRTITGRLGTLNASSLELLVRKTQDEGGAQSPPPTRLSERDVRKITLERHDSLLNGALIGLAAGAGPGILFIAGRSRGSDPIQHADTAIGLVAVPGAIGAGIGALIDVLNFQRTTVYLAPGQRSSRVQVLPLLSKSVVGAQMVARF